MKERRKYKRYYLKALLRVTEGGEYSNVDLESINISAGGIFFRSSTEILVGDRISLLFDLPDWHEPIEAGCEAVHSLETMPGKQYFVGVKFLKLEGITETELDTYLREHYDERGNKNS